MPAKPPLMGTYPEYNSFQNQVMGALMKRLGVSAATESAGKSPYHIDYLDILENGQQYRRLLVQPKGQHGFEHRFEVNVAPGPYVPSAHGAMPTVLEMTGASMESNPVFGNEVWLGNQSATQRTVRDPIENFAEYVNETMSQERRYSTGTKGIWENLKQKGTGATGPDQRGAGLAGGVSSLGRMNNWMADYYGAAGVTVSGNRSQIPDLSSAVGNLMGQVGTFEDVGFLAGTAPIEQQASNFAYTLGRMNAPGTVPTLAGTTWNMQLPGESTEKLIKGRGPLLRMRERENTAPFWKTTGNSNYLQPVAPQLPRTGSEVGGTVLNMAENGSVGAEIANIHRNVAFTPGYPFSGALGTSQDVLGAQGITDTFFSKVESTNVNLNDPRRLAETQFEAGVFERNKKGEMVNTGSYQNRLIEAGESLNVARYRSPTGEGGEMGPWNYVNIQAGNTSKVIRGINIGLPAGINFGGKEPSFTTGVYGPGEKNTPGILGFLPGNEGQPITAESQRYLSIIAGNTGGIPIHAGARDRVQINVETGQGTTFSGKTTLKTGLAPFPGIVGEQQASQMVNGFPIDAVTAGSKNSVQRWFWGDVATANTQKQQEMLGIGLGSAFAKSPIVQSYYESIAAKQEAVFQLGKSKAKVTPEKLAQFGPTGVAIAEARAGSVSKLTEMEQSQLFQAAPWTDENGNTQRMTASPQDIASMYGQVTGTSVSEHEMMDVAYQGFWGKQKSDPTGFRLKYGVGISEQGYVPLGPVNEQTIPIFQSWAKNAANMAYDKGIFNEAQRDEASANFFQFAPTSQKGVFQGAFRSPFMYGAEATYLTIEYINKQLGVNIEERMAIDATFGRETTNALGMGPEQPINASGPTPPSMEAWNTVYNMWSHSNSGTDTTPYPKDSTLVSPENAATLKSMITADMTMEKVDETYKRILGDFDPSKTMVNTGTGAMMVSGQTMKLISTGERTPEGTIQPITYAAKQFAKMHQEFLGGETTANVNTSMHKWGKMLGDMFDNPQGGAGVLKDLQRVYPSAQVGGRFGLATGVDLNTMVMSQSMMDTMLKRVARDSGVNPTKQWMEQSRQTMENAGGVYGIVASDPTYGLKGQALAMNVITPTIAKQRLGLNFNENDTRFKNTPLIGIGAQSLFKDWDADLARVLTMMGTDKNGALQLSGTAEVERNIHMTGAEWMSRAKQAEETVVGAGNTSGFEAVFGEIYKTMTSGSINPATQRAMHMESQENLTTTGLGYGKMKRGMGSAYNLRRRLDAVVGTSNAFSESGAVSAFDTSGSSYAKFLEMKTTGNARYTEQFFSTLTPRYNLEDQETGDKPNFGLQVMAGTDPSKDQSWTRLPANFGSPEYQTAGTAAIGRDIEEGNYTAAFGLTMLSTGEEDLKQIQQRYGQLAKERGVDKIADADIGVRRGVEQEIFSKVSGELSSDPGRDLSQTVMAQMGMGTLHDKLFGSLRGKAQRYHLPMHDPTRRAPFANEVVAGESITVGGRSMKVGEFENDPRTQEIVTANKMELGKKGMTAGDWVTVNRTPRNSLMLQYQYNQRQIGQNATASVLEAQSWKKNQGETKEPSLPDYPTYSSRGTAIDPYTHAPVRMPVMGSEGKYVQSYVKKGTPEAELWESGWQENYAHDLAVGTTGGGRTVSESQKKWMAERTDQTLAALPEILFPEDIATPSVATGGGNGGGEIIPPGTTEGVQEPGQPVPSGGGNGWSLESTQQEILNLLKTGRSGTEIQPALMQPLVNAIKNFKEVGLRVAYTSKKATEETRLNNRQVIERGAAAARIVMPQVTDPSGSINRLQRNWLTTAAGVLPEINGFRNSNGQWQKKVINEETGAESWRDTNAETALPAIASYGSSSVGEVLARNPEVFDEFMSQPENQQGLSLYAQQGRQMIRGIATNSNRGALSTTAKRSPASRMLSKIGAGLEGETELTLADTLYTEGKATGTLGLKGMNKLNDESLDKISKAIVNAEEAASKFTTTMAKWNDVMQSGTKLTKEQQEQMASEKFTVGKGRLTANAALERTMAGESYFTAKGNLEGPGAAFLTKDELVAQQLQTGKFREQYSRAYSKEVEARGLAPKDLAPEEGGTAESEDWGGFARRALGGFGLMFIGSVLRRAGGNIGAGQVQRTQYEQMVAGSVSQATGTPDIPYNQLQQTANLTALSGARNDPFQMYEQAKATTPAFGLLAGGVESAGATFAGATWLGGLAPDGSWARKLAEGKKIGIGLGAKAARAEVSVAQRAVSTEGWFAGEGTAISAGGIAETEAAATAGFAGIGLPEISLAIGTAEIVGNVINQMGDVDTNARNVATAYNPDASWMDKIAQRFNPNVNITAAQALLGIGTAKQDVNRNMAIQARLAGRTTFSTPTAIWSMPGKRIETASILDNQSPEEQARIMSATVSDFSWNNLNFSQEAITSATSLLTRAGIERSDKNMGAMTGLIQTGTFSEQMANQMLAITGVGLGQQYQKNAQGITPIGSVTQQIIDAGKGFGQTESLRMQAGMSVAQKIGQEITPFMSGLTPGSSNANFQRATDELESYQNSPTENLNILKIQTWNQQRQMGMNVAQPAPVLAASMTPQGLFEAQTQAIQGAQATSLGQTAQIFYIRQNMAAAGAETGAAITGYAGQSQQTMNFTQRLQGMQPLAITQLANKLGATSSLGNQLSQFASVQANGMPLFSTNMMQGSILRDDVLRNSPFGNLIGTEAGQAALLGGKREVQNQQILSSQAYSQQMFGFQKEQFAASSSYQIASLGLQKQGMMLEFAQQEYGQQYQQQNLDLATQQRQLGYAQTEYGFKYQQQSMNLQTNQFNQNMVQQQKEMTQSRSYTQQQWGFQDQTRDLQWGWKQQDFQEEERFMTGRQRKLADRQMGRDTIMHGIEGDQITAQRTNQQTLWKLEDERFAIQKQQYIEQKKLQEENLKQQERFYQQGKELQEQQAALQQDNLNKDIMFYQQRKALELQQFDLQQKNTLTNIDIQKRQMDAQFAYMNKMQDYDKVLTSINQAYEDQMAKVAMAEQEWVQFMDLIYSSLKTYIQTLGGSVNNGSSVNGGLGNLDNNVQVGNSGSVSTTNKSTQATDGIRERAGGGDIAPYQRYIVGETESEMFRAGVIGSIVTKRDLQEASKFNDHWQNQVVGGGSSTQGVGKQTINIFIGNEKLGKYVVDAVNKEVNA